MRGIERTTQFKREIKGRLWALLEGMFATLCGLLTTGRTLADRCRDHSLTDEWAGFRDGQVRPDLVLTYAKHDRNTLRLVRLGSHSELGL